MGRFSICPSVHPSICPFVPPLKGPRASQAGLRPSQSGLIASQAGLRAFEAWLASSEAWLAGSEACLAGSEVWLAGSEACLAGSWALKGGTDGWMENPQHSTGLCPLSGPLPCYSPTLAQKLYKVGQEYRWPYDASWWVYFLSFHAIYWFFWRASNAKIVISLMEKFRMKVSKTW